MTPHHSHRLLDVELRHRLACSEMENRVSKGDSNIAATLLADDSEMAQHDDFAIELIYAEFVALEQISKAPTLAQLIQRFPQWESRLRRLIDVHFSLQDVKHIDLHQKTDAFRASQSTEDGFTGDENNCHRSPRIFGQYEIIDEIARGGMGIVYKARHMNLDRIIALKLIRSLDVSSEEQRRFHTEAQAAAKLRHPNIVQVHDVGIEDGRDFLAMEYVDGPCLENYSKHQQLSHHESARIVMTLANAIQYAHDHGIVHRDLKPANILLSKREPKIVDFGLAKQMVVPSDRKKTRTGTVLGTPGYMSPEQIGGELDKVGPATDVYSLGVILYELLTKQLPFVGKNLVETAQLIRDCEPDQNLLLRTGVPRDLGTICLKCLAKEPGRRYATARDLAKDIDRQLSQLPVQARRPGRSERVWSWAKARPTVAILAMLLVVISIGSFIVISSQGIRESRLLSASASSERSAAQANAEAEVNLVEAKRAMDRLLKLGSHLFDQPGLGDVSLQTIEQTLQQIEALAQHHRSDPEVVEMTARAHAEVGKRYFGTGKLLQAKSALQCSSDLYRSVEKTERNMADRARVTVGLANSLRLCGKHEQSLKVYEHAIELFDELIQDNPDEVDYVVRRSNARNNMAILLLHFDRPLDALSAHCQSIEWQLMAIQKIMGERNSMYEAYFRSPLSNAHQRLLDIRQCRTRLQHHDKKLLEVCKKILLSELAISADQLGVLLLTLREHKVAEVAFRESLELRKLALTCLPDQEWRKAMLARSYARVGRFDRERNLVRNAIGFQQKAAAIYADLANRYPAREPYQHSVACAYTELAASQRQMKQLDAALANHRKADSIHMKLFHGTGFQPSPKSLCQTKYEMARTLVLTGQRVEAIDFLESAIQLKPDFHQAHHALAWLRLKNSEKDDWEKALVSSKAAIELSPNNFMYWWAHAWVAFQNNDPWQSKFAMARAIHLMFASPSELN